MDLDLLLLLIVLLAAWIAGAAATRLGLSSAVGALLAGIVLGPPVLGLLNGSPALSVLAEVGALMMMLYLGTEIDPRKLGRASWAGLLAAIGGFLLPFLLAYFVVVWFGGELVTALFVGIASGVTSILTTTRMLVRGRLLETRMANVILGGALVADTLALVAFATIVGVMDVGELNSESIVFVAFKALLFFTVTAAVGFKLFPWVGRKLTAFGLQNRSFHFTLVLVIAFAFGELAELAGLHFILGAFVAGLFLRENVLGRALATDLLKAARDASVGFLAPVFFVSAGFAVSLSVFQTHPALLAAIIAVAVVGKIAGTVLFYLPTKRGWREGLAIGTAMSGRGEIEIIIAGVGLQMGLISRDVFSILVIMAVVTTFLVPWLFSWSMGILRRRGELSMPGDARADTIIVGAGPLARAVGRVLSRTGRVRLVDSSKVRCDFAQSDGLDTTCGNALDESILTEVGAARAEMLIAMTGNAEVNALAAQIARTAFRIPQVLVVQSEHGGDGYETALDALKASTLFGGPILQDSWDHWIGQDELIRTKMPVRKLSSRSPMKLSAELKRRGEYLPLAVKREGRYVPFHSASEIHHDDELVLLAPRHRDGTSDAMLDRFDRMVARAPVLDLDRTMKFDEFLEIAIASLALQSEVESTVLAEAFLRRERMSSSILAPGLAVPHVLVDGEDEFHLLVARSRGGVTFPGQQEAVHSIFLIIRSADERAMHLKSLAAIAQTVQDPNFDERWLTAWGAEEIRRILLVAERRRFPEFETNGQENPAEVESV